MTTKYSIGLPCRVLCQSIVLSAISLAIIGCAPRVVFVVSVDSINDISRPEPSPRRYVLLPADSLLSNDPLTWIEMSSFVKIVLKRNGFIETAPESAQVAIFLGYGIGDPRTQVFSYSVPTLGIVQTGNDYSATTIGATTFVDSKPKYGLGVTGSQTVAKNVSLYPRWLRLDATLLSSLRESKQVVPLWRTIATSEGSSSDLRLVFPYMVAAAAESMGGNNGRKIEYQIREEDRTVLKLIEDARRPREN